MIDAFSEYERLIIKARTSSALQAKKTRKERVGSIPYGYRLSGDGIHLEEDPAEQRVVMQIRKLHEAGHGLRAICRKLRDMGFATRKGRTFEPQQIKGILQAA
jgi:DNA invertase Pin-like site-specific DNA recombinase